MAAPLLVFVAQVQGDAVQEIAGSGGGAGIGTDYARPDDADGGIVPGKAAFIVGVVEVVTLVAELGDIGQDKEAMGETAGNQELLQEMKPAQHTLGGTALIVLDKHDIPASPILL